MQGGDERIHLHLAVTWTKTAQSSSLMAKSSVMSPHMGAQRWGNPLLNPSMDRWRGIASAARRKISNGTVFQMPRHVQFVHRGGGF